MKWAGGLSAGTVYNSALEGFPLAEFITVYWAGGLSASTAYNTGLEGFPLAQFITMDWRDSR